MFFLLFSGQSCGRRHVRPEHKAVNIAIHTKLRFLHLFTLPQRLQMSE